jgi:protein-tyrosine phosphatase
MKILMVCLGNICRSPLAEGILQHKAQLAGLNWTVDSAGTNGYHNGEAPHPLSQKVARINGIDISHQQSRMFTAEDMNRFDKIFAMAKDVRTEMKRIAGKHWKPEKVELILNVLEPGANLDVPDPWYGPEDEYHEVFELLDKACQSLITNH